MARKVEPVLAAVLGPGTRYEGDMSFEGRVRIDGHFVGRIFTEDWLELGADGVIEGTADVANAVIAGRVQGELRVRERLVLEAGGSISGKVDVGVAEVRPGGMLDGQVRVLGTTQE